jgi:hypothetical protein
MGLEADILSRGMTGCTWAGHPLRRIGKRVPGKGMSCSLWTEFDKINKRKARPS